MAYARTQRALEWYMFALLLADCVIELLVVLRSSSSRPVLAQLISADCADVTRPTGLTHYSTLVKLDEDLQKVRGLWRRTQCPHQTFACVQSPHWPHLCTACVVLVQVHDLGIAELVFAILAVSFYFVPPCLERHCHSDEQAKWQSVGECLGVCAPLAAFSDVLMSWIDYLITENAKSEMESLVHSVSQREDEAWCVTLNDDCAALLLEHERTQYGVDLAGTYEAQRLLMWLGPTIAALLVGASVCLVSHCLCADPRGSSAFVAKPPMSITIKPPHNTYSKRAASSAVATSSASTSNSTHADVRLHDVHVAGGAPGEEESFDLSCVDSRSNNSRRVNSEYSYSV